MLRSGSIRIPGGLIFFASEETRPEMSPSGKLYLVPRESMLDSTPLGVLGQSQDKLQRGEVMLCYVVACYTAVRGELSTSAITNRTANVEYHGLKSHIGYSILQKQHC